MSIIFRALSIICLVVLSVYYPTIFAETCLLDDREMLSHLSAVQRFDIIGTFFPHSHGGLYYRPMVFVSFMMDRFLWNLDPAIMHLENVLLQLTSTILVFLITRLIIPKTSKLHLFAALLFAVHPIATESVNWISGRTDLLAVLFLLASLYSILCFRSSKHLWWLAVSVITLLFGIMTKETAIGFIPALVFIMASKNDINKDKIDEILPQRPSFIAFIVVSTLAITTALLLSNYYLPVVIVALYFFYLQWSSREHINKETFLKYLLLFSGSTITIWALFWGIRQVAFSSPSVHIKITFGRIFADMNYTLSLFFRAVGFYAKKFIFPFPLNFAIREVSPFYTLLGIFLLCVVVILLIRRKLPDTLIIAGFCMIVPALPLTFESIAWTSYAERYVYPATPFWILAMSGYAASAGFERLSLRIHRRCMIGLSFLIIVMSAFTFQRNIVWQTNLTLFSDSVEKTPDSKQLCGLYMTALFEKGMYDEALQQHMIIQTLPTIELKYNPNFDLYYVQILIAKKEFVKAELELDRINKKTKGKEADVYESYLDLASRINLKTVDEKRKKHITEKMCFSYDKWFELKKDPMILYRKGQFLLSLNMKSEAAKQFAKAATEFQANSPYRGYSEKLARKLSGKH